MAAAAGGADPQAQAQTQAQAQARWFEEVDWAELERRALEQRAMANRDDGGSGGAGGAPEGREAEAGAEGRALQESPKSDGGQGRLLREDSSQGPEPRPAWWSDGPPASRHGPDFFKASSIRPFGSTRVHASRKRGACSAQPAKTGKPGTSSSSQNLAGPLDNDAANTTETKRRPLTPVPFSLDVLTQSTPGSSQPDAAPKPGPPPGHVKHGPSEPPQAPDNSAVRSLLSASAASQATRNDPSRNAPTVALQAPDRIGIDEPHFSTGSQAPGVASCIRAPGDVARDQFNFQAKKARTADLKASRSASGSGATGAHLMDIKAEAEQGKHPPPGTAKMTSSGLVSQVPQRQVEVDRCVMSEVAAILPRRRQPDLRRLTGPETACALPTNPTSHAAQTQAQVGGRPSSKAIPQRGKRPRPQRDHLFGLAIEDLPAAACYPLRESPTKARLERARAALSRWLALQKRREKTKAARHSEACEDPHVRAGPSADLFAPLSSMCKRKPGTAPDEVSRSDVSGKVGGDAAAAAAHDIQLPSRAPPWGHTLENAPPTELEEQLVAESADRAKQQTGGGSDGNLQLLTSTVQVDADAFKAFCQRTLDAAASGPAENLRCLKRLVYTGRRYLKPYQRAGVLRMLQGPPRCLLYDEMGLGKTFQSLFCLGFSCLSQNRWPALIVCPASLRMSWVEEVERWMPFLSIEDIAIVTNGRSPLPEAAKVIIISYRMLEDMSKELVRRNIHFLIVDEVHKTRAYESLQTRSLAFVARSVRRAILATGTPMLIRPFELYTQLSIVLSEKDKNRTMARWGWRAQPRSSEMACLLESNLARIFGSPIRHLRDITFFTRGPDADWMKQCSVAFMHSSNGPEALAYWTAMEPGQRVDLLALLQSFLSDLVAMIRAAFCGSSAAAKSIFGAVVRKLERIAGDRRASIALAPGGGQAPSSSMSLAPVTMQLNLCASFWHVLRTSAGDSTDFLFALVHMWDAHCFGITFCKGRRASSEVRGWSKRPWFYEGANKTTLARLRAVMEPYVTRRRKQDVLQDLPAKRRQIIVVTPKSSLHHASANARADSAGSSSPRPSSSLSATTAAPAAGPPSSTALAQASQELERELSAEARRDPDFVATAAEQEAGILVPAPESPRSKQYRSDLASCALAQGLGQEQVAWNLRCLGNAKAPFVADYAIDLLQTLDSNERILIFARHLSVLDCIQSRLLAARGNEPSHPRFRQFHSELLSGAVPVPERDRIIRSFQTDEDRGPRALVLSIEAMGVGVTLTRASVVIMAELHWSPQVLLQAEDRAHRIGLKDSVSIQYILAENTFDAKLWGMLSSRLDVIEHALQSRADRSASAKRKRHLDGGADDRSRRNIFRAEARRGQSVAAAGFVAQREREAIARRAQAAGVSSAALLRESDASQALGLASQESSRTSFPEDVSLGFRVSATGRVHLFWTSHRGEADASRIHETVGYNFAIPDLRMVAQGWLNEADETENPPSESSRTGHPQGEVAVLARRLPHFMRSPSSPAFLQAQAFVEEWLDLSVMLQNYLQTLGRPLSVPLTEELRHKSAAAHRTADQDAVSFERDCTPLFQLHRAALRTLGPGRYGIGVVTLVQRDHHDRTGFTSARRSLNQAFEAASGSPLCLYCGCVYPQARHRFDPVDLDVFALRDVLSQSEGVDDDEGVTSSGEEDGADDNEQRGDSEDDSDDDAKLFGEGTEKRKETPKARAAARRASRGQRQKGEHQQQLTVHASVRALFCGGGAPCLRSWQVKCFRAEARVRLSETEAGICRKCKVDTRAMFYRARAHAPGSPERRDAIFCSADDLLCKHMVEQHQNSRAHARLHWSELQRKVLGPTLENKLLNATSLQEGLFWEADHVIAVRLGGGAAAMSNFQTLCKPCHLAKTRTDRTAIRKLKRDQAKHMQRATAAMKERFLPSGAINPAVKLLCEWCGFACDTAQDRVMHDIICPLKPDEP